MEARTRRPLLTKNELCGDAKTPSIAKIVTAPAVGRRHNMSLAFCYHGSENQKRLDHLTAGAGYSNRPTLILRTSFPR